MNTRYLGLLTVMAMSLVSLTAQARKYGAAGCGLGNLLFKKDNAILAATTNGTSASQMFGISSGTSNCTDDPSASAANRLPNFVESNRVALANDIARGNGETLASLSEVMGCSDSSAVGAKLQRNYAKIFSSMEAPASDVTNEILQVVKSDETLAAECRHVI